MTFMLQDVHSPGNDAQQNQTAPTNEATFSVIERQLAHPTRNDRPLRVDYQFLDHTAEPVSSSINWFEEVRDGIMSSLGDSETVIATISQHLTGGRDMFNQHIQPFMKSFMDHFFQGAKAISKMMCVI